MEYSDIKVGMTIYRPRFGFHPGEGVQEGVVMQSDDALNEVFYVEIPGIPRLTAHRAKDWYLTEHEAFDAYLTMCEEDIERAKERITSGLKWLESRIRWHEKALMYAKEKFPGEY